MWFLVTELWPYLAGALAIGLATGWLSGCKPAVARRTGAVEPETEVRP